MAEATEATAPEGSASPGDVAPSTEESPHEGHESAATTDADSTPAEVSPEPDGAPRPDDEAGFDPPPPDSAPPTRRKPPARGKKGERPARTDSAPEVKASPIDDSELTETIVWSGTARTDSRPHLEDDEDDVVTSSGASFEAFDRDLPDDLEVTVNLTGDLLPVAERDDLSEPTRTSLSEEELQAIESLDPSPMDDDDDGADALDASAPEAPPPDDGVSVAAKHLRGLVEALVFASDRPLRPGELARRAEAPAKEIRKVLADLQAFYAGRGLQLDEVGGAYTFRTNPVYAPFVRELTGQKPVKLTRAQVETLSILAYRQPITRPEIDDIRGVDSGPVLKMLLERDLIKILGKKDEPGRPILYGTTPQFLEFFGITSLKDLPTLREFTELNDDSKRVVERELGEPYEDVQRALDEEAIEHLPTNDLGPVEELPQADDEIDPAAETAASRVDEALREIERASEQADEDDDAPVASDTAGDETSEDESDEDDEDDEDDEPTAP